MQSERRARRLIQWSPLFSNHFAFTYGEYGDGIDLYHIGRPSTDAEAAIVGARGSITDKYLSEGFGGAQVS